MTSFVNYYVNNVFEISTSTGVYISVNYCSLQSCIPLEILSFGPVLLINRRDLPSLSPSGHYHTI